MGNVQLVGHGSKKWRVRFYAEEDTSVANCELLTISVDADSTLHKYTMAEFSAKLDQVRIHGVS